jgi:O-acetylhomoserine (thiol)-lyase
MTGAALDSVNQEDTLNTTSDFLCQRVIEDICQLFWEALDSTELMKIAVAYYYFSVQFRENLEIACRLNPTDQMLKRLYDGECHTDNLSPWPGITEVGEKLNHDEFIARLLLLGAEYCEPHLTSIGNSYLLKIRSLGDSVRASSIGSYEDGGLARVFQAMLRAQRWDAPSLQAFKFFLEQHILFDTDETGGHGALARHLRSDNRILPLWIAFMDLLVAAAPSLVGKPTGHSGTPEHWGARSVQPEPVGAEKESAVPALRKETIAVHGGYTGDAGTRAVAVPIYQTVAYEFDSAEHGVALFNLEVDGYRYTRISNPTTDVLDRRVAALEGGLAALCVSSGQAALHYAVLNLTQAGKNIVSVPQLYGTTHTLFAHLLPSLGIGVRFARSDQAADIDALVDRQTCAVFCESVGNPAGNICDIESLARVAHSHGVPLIVDNTVATPILLRPIEYGADIVVHSLTKFMGGHGTTLGGAIVDAGTFPWERHASRFPMFNEPDQSYHGLVYVNKFGRAAYIARCRSVYQRTMGAILAPISSFLLLQGIETIALRVDRHVENARRVAEFLQQDKRVEWVNYVGFPENPYHHLAQKYLGGRACSLITFGVCGGYQGGTRFYNALRLVKRLVNLGDAKSLACHPASTTHRQMPEAEQRRAGVVPEMIRMSVGIEHIDDILADLDQALSVNQSGDEERMAAN